MSSLHSNKFDPAIMKQLRLSFVSSKAIMDMGGAQQLREADFSKMVDPLSEKMAYEFLIDNVEQHLARIKPEDHYLNITKSETQITTLHEFNLRNAAQLHLDELAVLEKNLQYLQNMRVES